MGIYRIVIVTSIHYAISGVGFYYYPIVTIMSLRHWFLLNIWLEKENCKITKIWAWVLGILKARPDSKAGYKYYSRSVLCL